MTGGLSARYNGYTQAFSDNPEVARDIGFDKQMKKPNAVVPGEEILEGTTHESIQNYAEARRSGVVTPAPEPGLLTRLRKILRRS